MKVADSFVRGLNVFVSISRPSSTKACVIVVYHDCKHQNEHVRQISLNFAADMVRADKNSFVCTLVHDHAIDISQIIHT